jgi:toxin-antitoxin system PIN domain toxin
LSRALLDINILLALLDAEHLDHRKAREWFRSQGGAGWASCAVTQMGFVRIISQPRYGAPCTATEAIGRLADAVATEHHQFWPCEVAVTDAAAVDRVRVLGPGQVTDVYLLALAVAHAGRFVTLDRNVPLSAVPGASEKNLLVL